MYPPDVIHKNKKKEDTPMNYFNDSQLWAEVKDYYVDWEKEAFAGPGRYEKARLGEFGRAVTVYLKGDGRGSF